MGQASPLYDIEVLDIKGQSKRLSDFQGQVLLIVNTASKCGFTPQFEGLQKLYDTYKDRGLAILGFPCNQFMNQ
ncbi:MAG: redoxin domain-containing protein, partial [Gammaproteobacteria bacterium]|nr:redoxin domain-containing protein [Gammaproteobacteria bacterium]